MKERERIKKEVGRGKKKKNDEKKVKKEGGRLCREKKK